MQLSDIVVLPYQLKVNAVKGMRIVEVIVELTNVKVFEVKVLKVKVLKMKALKVSEIHRVCHSFPHQNSDLFVSSFSFLW